MIHIGQKKMMRFRPLLLCGVATVLALGPLADSAHAAGTLLTTTIGWGNKAGAKVSGPPGTTYDIIWKRGTTVLGSTSVTIPGAGQVIVAPPAGVDIQSGDTVNIGGKPSAGTPTYAAMFNPPSNYAVASHAVTEGTATGLGLTFVLSGGFDVVALDIDRDHSSPTYGDLSGFVDSANFSIIGSSTSTTDTFELALLSDQSYVANLASVLDALTLIGQSASFSIPVSGQMILNESMSVPFTGIAEGTAFYDPWVEGFETYELGFTLTSSLGDFSGALTSEGIAVVVPAPASLALLALSGLIALRRRGR
jgi:hypothetical protein